MIDISILNASLESRLGSKITNDSYNSLKDIHTKPSNCLIPIITYDGEERAFTQSELMEMYFKSIQQNFEKLETPSYELFDFIKYETDIALKEHIVSEIIENHNLDLSSTSFEVEQSDNNKPENSTFSYSWSIISKDGQKVSEGTKSFTFNSVLFVLMGKVFNR